MIRHVDLGPTPFARLRRLVSELKKGAIALGGHRPGKLYGRLDCRAGKRMKPENRVFFRNATEAIAIGYRPCAVCMPEAYKTWKANTSNAKLPLNAAS
ncbi:MULTISPECIES: Ada metal-binding domain-containing protein [unclassified Spirosoma]|uniref:Ada metal-binding domain-containing protein n=1 Tax=unclassified Spirosoma TaxID=2621999 RepID=UPI0009621EDC|nr:MULTISPECIES: Ada metal-binding domain-containing protein [unclassified Spirosoma]MBN8823543.1 metal-binding protein [Spirosoma sp.]OJW71852.1 MAG: metal-binding protein [Spirosoma sp. 48-14]